MNTAVIFLCKDHRIIVHYVSRLLQIHCLKTGKKSLVARIRCFFLICLAAL